MFITITRYMHFDIRVSKYNTVIDEGNKALRLLREGPPATTSITDLISCKYLMFCNAFK